jgi:hypothetical protein
MISEHSRTQGGLVGILAAFLIGMAVGCFFSTFIAIKSRARTGNFVVSDTGLDYGNRAVGE